jgi:adenylate cyclase class 2
LAGEVEVKARVESREKLAKKIESLGGRFTREVAQEDVYFIHPCRNLRERDEALRLRREGGECILTFKGKRVGKEAKIREEIEVRVDDFEATQNIFSQLGFEKLFIIRKSRKDFLLDGATISLDSVEGLGEFVEIEVMVPSMKKDIVEDANHMQELKRKLFAIAERLEVPTERLTTESYLEMLASKSSSSIDRR